MATILIALFVVIIICAFGYFLGWAEEEWEKLSREAKRKARDD